MAIDLGYEDRTSVMLDHAVTIEAEQTLVAGYFKAIDVPFAVVGSADEM